MNIFEAEVRARRAQQGLRDAIRDAVYEFATAETLAVLSSKDRQVVANLISLRIRELGVLHRRVIRKSKDLQ